MKHKKPARQGLSNKGINWLCRWLSCWEKKTWRSTRRRWAKLSNFWNKKPISRKKKNVWKNKERKLRKRKTFRRHRKRDDDGMESCAHLKSWIAVSSIQWYIYSDTQIYSHLGVVRFTVYLHCNLQQEDLSVIYRNNKKLSDWITYWQLIKFVIHMFQSIRLCVIFCWDYFEESKILKSNYAHFCINNKQVRDKLS